MPTNLRIIVQIIFRHKTVAQKLQIYFRKLEQNIFRISRITIQNKIRNVPEKWGIPHFSNQSENILIIL